MINKETEKLICKKAIENFGEFPQMIKCIEELSELQRAISRAILKQPIGDISPNINFNEELADAEIMIQQMKETYYFDKKIFEEFKEKKIKKLQEVIW